MLLNFYVRFFLALLELCELLLNCLLLLSQELYFLFETVSPLFDTCKFRIVFLGIVADTIEVPFQSIVLLLQIIILLPHSAHLFLLLLYCFLVAL